MTGKNQQNYNKNYIEYVHSFAPPTKHSKNLGHAFLVGGFICCIGQFFRIMLSLLFGLEGDELAGTVSILLIFLGCLLTGLGVYDRIGRNAGAGSIVPITGFANSVASPAIEFKTEGFIYGMAAKMFVVAGPILVFGILSGV
ncbi:MAG: SpoVA/SpoVAEb family sporulation membrane protein, partial [Christensenellaceae bacterium]